MKKFIFQVTSVIILLLSIIGVNDICFLFIIVNRKNRKSYSSELLSKFSFRTNQLSLRYRPVVSVPKAKIFIDRIHISSEQSVSIMNFLWT